MNTSNNTCTCPECGGNKCTPVSKGQYRCSYCGATFYVGNPDNQKDDDDDDDVDEVLQELDEEDKAEEAEMNEIAAWLKAQNDYPALEKKNLSMILLSVVGALLGGVLAFAGLGIVIGILEWIFDCEVDAWSDWIIGLFSIGCLYCLWKALKWSFIMSWTYLVNYYGNKFVNKYEYKLLQLFSKKDLETFRENYMAELMTSSDEDNAENQ
ncbi:MAG TPA: hypothetical protein DIW30_04900 [Bacteroidales bacterium]|nr:hypothetical protein [Bacteroidales bacterium]